MQFKEGTPVYTADDQKVGEIERFVVDPRTEQIVGLVVRKGFWFADDRVVSANTVEEATAERVTLREEVSSPDDFPIFEEIDYVSPPENEFVVPYTDNLHGPLYHYPPVGWTGWRGTVYTPGAPGEAIVKRNIPEDTVAIQEGADVISRDGKKVGNVEEVMTSGDSRMVTHFAISKGFLFFKSHKLVPMTWVTDANEREVYLAVGTQTMEKLPDYEPADS